MDHRFKTPWIRITAGSPPVYLEMIGLLLLFGIGIFWWQDILSSPSWMCDGRNYELAIDLVRRGRSPYESRLFPYPPTIAVLGAWATELLGPETFRFIYRHVNLLSGCAAIWGSLYLTGWPWVIRLVIAGVGIRYIPALEMGMTTDNLSIMCSGAAIAALILWQRVPFLAGILLGLSLSLKPVALLAIFLLAAHRPIDSQHRHLVTAAVAAFTFCLLQGLAPGWFFSGIFNPNVKATSLDWSTAFINASLYRVFTSFGLAVSPFLFPIIFLILGLIYVRRRPLNNGQLCCIACSASLLSLPVVWSHTLLLVLPVQSMAFALASRGFIREWRGDSGNAIQNGKRYRGLIHLLLVGAGCLTVTEANGYGILVYDPLWVNGTIMLIPLISLFLITGYAVRCEAAHNSLTQQHGHSATQCPVAS